MHSGSLILGSKKHQIRKDRNTAFFYIYFRVIFPLLDPDPQHCFWFKENMCRWLSYPLSSDAFGSVIFFFDLRLIICWPWCRWMCLSHAVLFAPIRTFLFLPSLQLIGTVSRIRKRIQVGSTFDAATCACGWDLAASGWDLAEWLEEFLTANAKVATVLGSIPASSDTVESGEAADVGVLNKAVLRIRIRDLGWLKSHDPDPGWTTRIISYSLKTIFFV